MGLCDDFAGIIQREQPLAPFTHLRLGGPAQYLITPRSRDELAKVIVACSAEKIPLKVLGVGTNLLVRDEGIRAAVVRLTAPSFTEIKVDGKRLKTGGGATLAAAIATASVHGLAGFETLVGITATIGGALRCNAGDRAGEIADHVKRIEVMDERGQVLLRDRAEMHFGDHSSDIEEPVVLSVEFELIPDSADAIVKRLRRAWINRKATQPFSFQAAVRMFKNPRGYLATALIEKAGLAKTKVGAAEVSERNGNYLVAHPGTTAKDVLQLIDQVQRRVREACGVVMDRGTNRVVTKRLRDLLLRILLACAGSALVLGGIFAVASYLREDLRFRERYQISIDDIECNGPTDEPRYQFLGEVHYYGQLPEKLNVLDADLPEKLKAAFLKHPRVERVERVTVSFPKSVHVNVVIRN